LHPASVYESRGGDAQSQHYIDHDLDRDRVKSV